MSGGLYLAYPIDQRGPSSMVQMFDQVEKFKSIAIETGAAEWVFDPGDAFRVSGRPTEEVARINRHAHAMAESVAAFLPSGVASIGVPMEIDRAMQQDKAVAVFSEVQSYMLEFNRKDAPAQFKDWTDADLYAACEYIIAYNAQRDPERWERRTYLPFKLEKDGFLPVRTYEDDAGLDLIVSKTTLIGPGTFRDIPCGASVELPPHQWGLVTGRSSALRKRGVLVNTGIIDPGYRGELFAGAWNMLDKDILIERGERIAQFIVVANATRHWIPTEVAELAPSARGSNGFGSTGA